jgi:hypothetical protein
VATEVPVGDAPVSAAGSETPVCVPGELDPPAVFDDLLRLVARAVGVPVGDRDGVIPLPNSGGLGFEALAEEWDVPDVSPRAAEIGMTYCLPAGELGST